MAKLIAKWGAHAVWVCTQSTGIDLYYIEHQNSSEYDCLRHGRVLNAFSTTRSSLKDEGALNLPNPCADLG